MPDPDRSLPGAGENVPCGAGAEPEEDGDSRGEEVDCADSSPVEAHARVDERQLGQWIAAIVDHDERALAALYDATFSRMFGLVLQIVRHATLAEEVVEDSYFQIWRQAVRFDAARGHALAWMLSIARSRAIDAWRHEKRFRHESVDDAADETVAAADDTLGCDELLALARHHADLHQALTQLGAQPRQLVALAFFRGLSHEEIAHQTCLPLGTVKSQIRRALQTLRTILDDGIPPALAVGTGASTRMCGKLAP